MRPSYLSNYGGVRLYNVGSYMEWIQGSNPYNTIYELLPSILPGNYPKLELAANSGIWNNNGPIELKASHTYTINISSNGLNNSVDYSFDKANWNYYSP